ncbi:methyl-accepting chemotaxis protein [Idiomarina loihiensis]|uniref:methyl-accepting chemotaxis protein n=1 Tax=Idiomarina TaxID=135575 RepID=UPI000D711B33|nr:MULTISPECIES: methyl-accepting chemotaxis protein [Idiomarina]PWW36909.1 methyl-accepting chemotaxis protein [Idiomarina loihiensis]TDP46717.1 methyl-accepting chemotaxis protein [Idiomarina loihiensis]TDS22988.1 methyl-accepting chemotaxis protein [Idiomarina sp. H2]
MIRQFSIGVRASVAFGLIGALTLILGLFSLNRMGLIQANMNYISNEHVPALDNINGISRAFLRVRVHSANVATFYSDADRIEQYKERLDDAVADVKRNQNEFSEFINDDKVLAEYQNYMELNDQYWQYLEQQEKLIDAQLGDAITSLREKSMIPLTTKITASVNKMLDREREIINDSKNQSNEVAENANTAVIIVLFVVVVLLILFAFILTRSIVRPIGEAVRFSKTIASRDLTQTIEIDGKDEPAQLLRQLRITQEQLRESIGKIAESSEQLASTSEELSSVTQESTRTIQQQSEELEQAATAVNELTTAVETVAQDAQNASEASDEANQQAQQGNDRVRQTVRAIEELSQEIGDSSGNVTELADKVKSIAKVLEVIRGIAEQTNLLALNAAIEAARAGESGRGFAVVADEVRSLAHKTQQSTVEIEDMVKAINESSDRSVATMDRSLERATKTLDVAREAGEALQLIATAVSEINNHNVSIASAAEEQANVAKDVDKNLVSIRDLSNSTASGAEQTSASSEELSRLAVSLNELVERFKI